MKASRIHYHPFEAGIEERVRVEGKGDDGRKEDDALCSAPVPRPDSVSRAYACVTVYLLLLCLQLQQPLYLAKTLEKRSGERRKKEAGFPSLFALSSFASTVVSVLRSFLNTNPVRRAAGGSQAQVITDGAAECVCVRRMVRVREKVGIRRRIPGSAAALLLMPMLLQCSTARLHFPSDFASLHLVSSLCTRRVCPFL